VACRVRGVRRGGFGICTVLWLLAVSVGLVYFAAPAAGQGALGGAPAASFRGRDLTDHNFSRQNLTGADFRGATLDGAQFLGTTLDGAHFDGAKIGVSSKGPARFTGASLRGAHFAKARLDRVDLQYADLSCTEFTGVDLRSSVMGPAPRIDAAYASAHHCRTRFDGGSLRYDQLPLELWKLANLDNASMTGLHASSVSFQGRDLSGIEFAGAPLAGFDLRGATLTDAYLAGADLRGAKLQGAKGSGVQMPGARLGSAQMTRIDFYDPTTGKPAVLTGATLKHAALDGADLRHADLSEATFDGASLGCTGSGSNRRCARLSNAIFQRGKEDGATFIGSLLDFADLTSAVLNSVDFQDASLVHAKLDSVNTKGTDFTAANLTGASFRNATLTGVQFFGADLENVSFESAHLLTDGSGKPVDFSCTQLGGASFVNATLVGTRFLNAVLPPQDQCCKQVGGTYYCGTAVATEDAYGPTVRPKLTGPVDCPNGDHAQCTGDQWLIPSWTTSECNGAHRSEVVWQKPDCGGGHHGKYVQFADPKLEACIEQQLFGKTGQRITVDLAKTVSHVLCPDAGIAKLGGLEQFAALKILDLSGNAVRDPGPIENLNQLEVLRMADNQVARLDLAGLSSLGVLDVSGNPLASMTGLADVYFSSLDVSGTHLEKGTDLGLGEQDDLFFADLSNARFQDVGDLSQLTSLTYLYLDGNQLRKVDGLASIACPDGSNLQDVSLACNPQLDCSKVDFGSCADGQDLKASSRCGQNDLPQCRQGKRAAGSALPACVPAGARPTRLVYVAPGGHDRAGCGAAPEQACASPKQGLAQCAGHAGCAVALAWGDYPIAAPLALAGGVGLYGGCLFGSASSDRPPVLDDPNALMSRLVGAAAVQPVVVAHGLHAATVLSGLQVWAETPSAAGGASRAMAVDDSAGLHLERMVLVAGNGQQGARGADGSQGADGGKGASVTSRNGAAAKGGTVSGCSGTSGGEGADRNTLSWTRCKDCSACKGLACGCVGYAVEDGRSGTPGDTGSWAGGGPGRDPKVYASCPATPLPARGGQGDTGGNGTCGAPGKQNDDRFGWFESGAWKATRGGTGQRGGNGGGGGGGGAGGACDVPCGFKLCPGNFLDGQAGGGGGAGGCGAAPGQGGQMGGASIALTVSGKAPTFTAVTLIPASGGAGGAGGVGKVGGDGGKGGGSYSYHVCDGFAPKTATGAEGGLGGAGGIGGASAGGAGGNGGPAVGVALVGAGTKVSPVTIYPGRGGAGGHGGAGGKPDNLSCHGGNGKDGATGAVVDSHDFTHAGPHEAQDAGEELPPAPPEPEPGVHSGSMTENQPEPKELKPAKPGDPPPLPPSGGKGVRAPSERIEL